MHDLSVLMTFAGGLAGALVLGYLAQRVRLSPIVGYLLAGIAVGPFTPGDVANHALAEQFAEIGVILLLSVNRLDHGAAAEQRDAVRSQLYGMQPVG